MIDTIRKFAVTTGEGVHSADWLFLICQSLYWVKTGGVTGKSASAEWAEKTFRESWCDALDHALRLRRNPELAKTAENKAWLTALGPTIQKACDDLEQCTSQY